MEYIELKNTDRETRESCSKAIAQIEKSFEERLLKGEKIVCAICNKDLEKRFRSASRVFTHDHKVLMHPVHIDCVQDHTPINDLFGKDLGYFDISSLDLLIINGLIDHLIQLEKEGKLQSLPDDTDEDDPMTLKAEKPE